MEQENMESQEQKVQATTEDDGVIKVDLRNFKQEQDGVSSENAEQTGMRMPDDELPVSSDAEAGNADSDEPSEVRERAQRRRVAVQ